MRFLKTLSLASIALAFLILPARAADETTILDTLSGQPSLFVQGLRDTFGKVYLTVVIHDAQTPSNAVNPPGGTVVSPVAGTITLIQAVVLVSIANGISVQNIADGDGTVVGRINGTAITAGVITLSTGTGTSSGNWGNVDFASNDVNTATPTGANTVAVGDVLRFDSDGVVEEDIDILIIIEIDRDDL